MFIVQGTEVINKNGFRLECGTVARATAKADELNNPPFDLETAIKIKLTQNRDTAQSKIDTAFLMFAQFEIDTFPMQERDYDAYTLDPLAPTPYIDGILLDGETKAELMGRIGGNIAYVKSIQKQMRQNSKNIQACTTQAQLEAIIL